jgi:hypothetical protein
MPAWVWASTTPGSPGDAGYRARGGVGRGDLRRDAREAAVLIPRSRRVHRGPVRPYHAHVLDDEIEGRAVGHLRVSAVRSRRIRIENTGPGNTMSRARRKEPALLLATTAAGP